MKGIQPIGRCPKCHDTFKKDDRRGYHCPDCRTQPQYFLVVIHFKGERIRRATDLSGKTIRSHADAYALYRQAQTEIERHTFNPAQWRAKDLIDYRFSTQIGKWYDEKLDLMKGGERAPSYVPKLKTYVQHYFLPHFLDTDVREIHSLKGLFRSLPKSLSLKYKRNIMDAARGFFKWLHIQERLIHDMPFCPIVEVPEHVPFVISPEQQRLILGFIPVEHTPIFTFLFFQGVRPSEARALKWRDIDGDTVCIRRTWSGRRDLREQTKNKRVRFNLLFSETLEALPRRGFPEDFVFTHGKGLRRHYSIDLLNKIFNSAALKAGLNVTLYEATKHSFGTFHVNNGISKDVLQKWFGHTSAKSTEIYAKLNAVDAFRRLQKSNSVVEIKTKIATKTPQ